MSVRMLFTLYFLTERSAQHAVETLRSNGFEPDEPELQRGGDRWFVEAVYEVPYAEGEDAGSDPGTIELPAAVDRDIEPMVQRIAREHSGEYEPGSYTAV
jgi:hypothetical protein